MTPRACCYAKRANARIHLPLRADFARLPALLALAPPEQPEPPPEPPAPAVPEPEVVVEAEAEAQAQAPGDEQLGLF